jgi:hypothetical protein
VDKPSGAEIIEVPAKHRPFVATVLGELPEVTRAGISLVRGGISPEDKPTSDGIVPVHRSTVISCEPTLSWPRVPEAVAYEVTVSYGGGVSAWSATTTGTSLECCKERALKSGSRFRWEVQAELSGGVFRPVYFGSFAVASEELRAKATELAQLITDGETSSLALAAMWYFDKGFYAEATDVAERLTEKAPHDPSALRMLHVLYQRAGQHENAREVLKRILDRDPVGPTTAPQEP